MHIRTCVHTLKKLTSTQFFGNSDGTTFVSNRMRKGTVLTTEDQTAIIKQLESRSAEVIAERYGVGKSMISDIKNEFSQNFLCLKQGMRNIGMSKKARWRWSTARQGCLLVVQTKVNGGWAYIWANMECPAAHEDALWGSRFLWKHRVAVEVLQETGDLQSVASGCEIICRQGSMWRVRHKLH